MNHHVHQKLTSVIPEEKMTLGQRLADKITSGIGSWKFILIQSAIVVLWMGLNGAAILYQWDPYPFTFLNLVFSTQAAYAAPIIMMSQNRQSERDRLVATHDLAADLQSIEEIKKVQEHIAQIEIDKLDKILTILEKFDQLQMQGGHRSLEKISTELLSKVSAESIS